MLAIETKKTRLYHFTNVFPGKGTRPRSGIELILDALTKTLLIFFPYHLRPGLGMIRQPILPFERPRLNHFAGNRVRQAKGDPIDRTITLPMGKPPTGFGNL